MSKLNPPPEGRPGPPPFQTTADGSVAESDDDFAAEHESTSFANDLRGGPEGAPEPESPTGHSGMDPN